MKLIVKKARTSLLVRIFIANSSSTTGAGLTGLTSGSGSLTCYRARDDDGNAGATQISLSGGTKGTWSSGGFVEKDATNMPGWYEFGIPDNALASGSESVDIELKGAANMAPCNLEIQLVAYDPQLATNLGLSALPTANPGAANGVLIAGTNAAVTITSGAGDALTISSTGTNGNGMNVSGNGSGHGLKTTGGATGHGHASIGGATSGDGINSVATTSGHGLTVTGVGTTKHGVNATGGSTTSAGISAAGGGAGNGITATGGATGHGVGATGGATSGDGINAVAATSGHGLTATGVGTTKHGVNATGGSTTSHGISAAGGGAGDGIKAVGGATGNAMELVGGATSGDALKATTTSGHGFNIVATGTAMDAIHATGAAAATTNAGGHGINATGGAASTGAGGTSGKGLCATGGAGAASTNGASEGLYVTGGGTTTVSGADGLKAIGSGNLNGMEAVGAGSGDGFKSTGGATGNAWNLIGGATSGDGLKVTSTLGHGFNIAATGASKHGITATGGDSGTSDGIKAVAGTGGVDFRANQTGNLTGNVSGSVGSVTGLTASDVGSIKTQTDKFVFTVTNQVDSNVLDWKSATAPAMTGDAFARLGAPAGASVSADVAAVKVDTAAVKVQTDKFVFSVANQVDSNVIDWKGATAPAMTGDAFARLGAPAGASIAADLAEIEIETDDIAAIKTQTDKFVFSVANQVDSNVIDWKGATAPAMTGDAFARLGAPAGASIAADLAEIEVETDTITSAPSAATIAAAVWDELKSAHTVADTFGDYLDAKVSLAAAPPSAATVAAAVWDEATAGHVAAGTFGKLEEDTNAASAPSAATIADAVWDEVAAGHVTAGSFGKLEADTNTAVGAVKTQTDKLTFTVTNQIDANVLDWKSATAPAMTGDAFARLGAPAGASVSADVAAVKVDTAAVKVQTDKFVFSVANQVDSNVIDWKGATAPAMTGDAFARLGVAGVGLTNLGDTRIAHLDADVSTRLATSGYTVPDNSDIAAIKAITDQITFTVANQVDSNVLDWKSATAPAMTGDAFARLGAPAGASVSADIAEIEAETDTITSSPSAGTIAAAVWDELKSDHTIPDSFGDYLDDAISSRLADSSYTAPDNTDIAAIKVQTDKLTFTVPGVVDSNVVDWKNSTAPANTGDAFARLGAPAGASVSADIAEVEGETDDIAAIKTQTDKLTFTVANQVDSNVIDWKGATAPAMTGDAFARLGAPAGASIAADIAEIEVETDDIAAIKTKTDSLTFTVPGLADSNVVDWKGATAPANTGDAFARLGAPVGASISADIAEIEGETDDIAAIKTKTDSLTFTVANQVDSNVLDWKGATAPAMTGDAFARLGVAGVGLTNLGDTRIAHLDADVSTRLAASSYTAPDNADIVAIKAKTDNLPVSPASTGDVTTAKNAVLAVLGTPAGASLAADLVEIEGETDDIAAIKTKTDSLTFTIANQVDSNVLDWKGATAPAMTGDAFARLGAPVGASISADVAGVPNALLDQTSSIETGLTLRKALRFVLSVLGGKLSGAGTGTEVFKNAVADSKTRVTATIDENGNRTDITTDLT